MSYYFNALTNIFNYKGRATRSEYWYFVLFNILLVFITGWASERFFYQYISTQTVVNALLLYQLFLFIPYFSLAVRRLHDVGKNGWMVLIGFIPLLGWIWLLILFVKGSNKFDNKYGPYAGAVNMNSEDEKSKAIKEISPEKWNFWLNRLTYLLGIGIISSGYFTWIKVYGSAGGHSSNFSGDGGFMYTIPAGVLALIFTYDKKLQPYRKYYGLALVALSCYLFLSYTRHISVSAGGYSASGGTKAGLGVILLAITSSLYLLANLIKPATFGRIFTPLFIILSLLIWFTSLEPWFAYCYEHDYINTYARDQYPFYVINTYSISFMAFIALIALLFRKKINLSKSKLMLIMTLFTYTSLIYWRTLHRYFQPDTDLGLQDSFLSIQSVFNYINIASVLVAFVLLATNLMELLKDNFQNDNLLKIYNFFNRQYVKIIWLLVSLIVMSFIMSKSSYDIISFLF